MNICEAFAAKLKGDIEELPENSIKIKKNRKKIEQVKREEYWNNLSEDLIKKLKLEIAPLTKWIEGVDNSDSVAFDNFIYKIMVNNISNDKDNLVREINDTIKKLSRLKINLNQFEDRRELVILIFFKSHIKIV